MTDDAIVVDIDVVRKALERNNNFGDLLIIDTVFKRDTKTGNYEFHRLSGGEIWDLFMDHIGLNDLYRKASQIAIQTYIEQTGKK